MKTLLPKVASALALFLLTAVPVLAQDTGTIEGQVLDAESDAPLPAVNVVVQPLGVGGITDAEGLFEITGVPPGEYTLVATFVGYQEFEQAITVSPGETVELQIMLQPSVAVLEGVVVEGYRIDTGVEPTGAVAEVSAETLAEANVQTVTEAVQGRMAGVRVTSSSGSPGAGFRVQVRGSGSINAGTQPIYIVDGVQLSINENNSSVAAYSPLAAIDPDDIQSFRVLKDAAAAAIYGARAANGVVLITTKQGQSGETRVNFSASVGAVQELRPFNTLSSTQWGRYHFDAVANTFMEVFGFPTRESALLFYQANWGIPSIVPEELPSYNWTDAVNRTGITQSYDLSVSGGSEDTQFYISGGYEIDKGQIIKSDAEQINLIANLDHNISNDVQVGVNLNLSTFSKRGIIGGGPFINSPFWSSRFIMPWRPIYNDPEVGRASGFNTWGSPAIFIFNPVQQVTFNDRFTNQNQIIGNVSGSWQIAPWLVARSQVGLSYQDSYDKDYRDPRMPTQAAQGGSGFAQAYVETVLNARQLLNYNFFFEQVHSLSGLVGIEYRREYERFVGGSGINFPNYRLRNLSSAAQPTGSFEFETESRLLSFFAEVEYGFDNRYQVQVTGRVDGSSRFGENNQFGTFGAVSGAWNISNEAFMDDVDFVNRLSLSASYGILGNSEINDFVAARLYGTAGEYAGTLGLEPSSLGNPNLTWEESQTINLSLDYALFGSRVFGTISVFDRTTNRLLLERSLPSDSGFNSFLTNVGVINNKGLEYSLSTINVDAGGFRWSTSFNITFLESEVVELAGGDTLLVAFEQPGGNFYEVGKPLGLYKTYVWAGVNPANGVPMMYDEDGNLTYFFPSADAREYQGNVQPEFYGGLGNTFSFKGLTLSVFFMYDYGRHTFNNNAYFFDGYFGTNHTTQVLDYWQEPGDYTDTPKPYFFGINPNGPSLNSVYFATNRNMEDASFIRLKNVRLNYDLPAAAVKALGLQGASIFVQGKNLATFTNYSGLDPETVGTALAQYPQNQTYTAGFNITF